MCAVVKRVRKDKAPKQTALILRNVRKGKKRKWL